MTRPAHAAGRRGGWRRAVRLLWLAAVAIALVVVLADRWAVVAAHLAGARPAPLAASAVLGLAAVGVSGAVWRSLLAGLGAPLPPRAASGVFFVGQLGKYLPGGVWPLLAQSDLGRVHDVPARASVAAVALFLWVHLATGAAVAALALPAAGVAPPAVALLAVPALGGLTPGLLERAVTLGLRLTRREPLPLAPGAAAIAASVGWATLMWACFGAHLAFATAALGGGVPLLFAAGAFALAWCAGFVLVVAPAGVGVREAVMVAVLLPALPAGGALAAALVSRLLVTLADVAWGVAGLALRRRAG